MDDGTTLVVLGEIIVVLLTLIGVGIAACVLQMVRVRGLLEEVRVDNQERQQAGLLREIVGGTAQAPVDMFKLFKHIQRSREVEWEKPPLEIELIRGRADIMESMKALCEKYYLDAFTISTDDGLVVASSGGDAASDAAKYSYVFSEGRLPDDPTVMLFGIQHKGSSLVGILHTEHNIPETWVQDMEHDAVEVLQQWL
ncbi:hypothetical protein E2N92_04930 [Methanofollis formosanus]|uniref:Uncharacterized protein n=1 Tax=Methanofollis formosanus TaxID=299308 RepID=A0A8G1A1T2_9EURY|nr:hypothetical protein [Methanofollis formosanus]QYZ78819.1 hypothetical protein E2N92_04930 [Methanofollis formosanus]